LYVYAPGDILPEPVPPVYQKDFGREPYVIFGSEKWDLISFSLLFTSDLELFLVYSYSSYIFEPINVEASEEAGMA